MDEDLLLEKEPIIPTITVDHHIHTQNTYFVAVPEVLRTVYDALLQLAPSKVVSSIKVSFPELEEQEEVEEFDDEEQLYKSSTAVLAQQDSKTIELRQTRLNNQDINFLLVPVFKNKLIYNLVASALFQHFGISKLVCFATSELSGLHTLNKLVSPNFKLPRKELLLEQVPDMRPPNFITGAPGALVSHANIYNVEVAAIAVSAEGAFQLDMEKFDVAALVDLAAVVDDYLGLGGDYVQIVRELAKVKKAGSGSNALYI
ncbi:hypothetical protein KL932_001535 [Ogataea haglerorum]|nr:hypothetical protein KL932_001535 [Ogataea haglerorum]